jgi:hypothetical protein
MSDMNSVYTAPSALFPPPPNFPDANVQIYVGSWQSAVDESAITNNSIEGILNVAYDVDDQPGTSSRRLTVPDAGHPWQAAHTHPAATGQTASRYAQQYAKVGLIDGAGNAVATMLAAVYMADQLFSFPPESVTDPLNYSRGNLLIHCYAGQSRSVTVAALYIYYKFGLYLGDSSVSNFQTTYSMVQAARNDNDPPPPTVGMQSMAETILASYTALFPNPVYQSPTSR